LTTPIALSYLISGLIEVLLPLVFSFFLIKRLRTSWKIWFIGALMFLVSLVRFPLNNYLTDLVVSGTITNLSFWLIYLIPSFTAGIFEETARYLGLRYLVKNESYRSGLTYGAGHGGIESIFLVGLNILTIGIILLTNPDSLPQMQLNTILATPWYLPLVGAYERVMVMTIHISLSIMVLESLRQKKIMYLLLAIIVHTAINYLSVSAVGYSVLYAEMVVTGFAIGLAQWAYSRVKDEIMA
jgi:uncharacterized membrane protein YhfC